MCSLSHLLQTCVVYLNLFDWEKGEWTCHAAKSQIWCVEFLKVEWLRGLTCGNAHFRSGSFDWEYLPHIWQCWRVWHGHLQCSKIANACVSNWSLFGHFIDSILEIWSHLKIRTLNHADVAHLSSVERRVFDNWQESSFHWFGAFVLAWETLS